jgi:hypothetical protein
MIRRAAAKTGWLAEHSHGSLVMRPSCFVAMLTILLHSSMARVAGADDGRWYANRESIDLRLEGPFPDLFAKARRNPEYEIRATLSYVEPGSTRRTQLPGVLVSTRGHTSRRSTECVFPKLKLRFTSRLPEASMFAGIRTLKLGTHCADLPGEQLTPKFGRLGNQKAPLREAMVYALLDAVNVPTLRTRPARIAYIFTDAAGHRRASLVRNALLLEDDDDAKKRLGATTQLKDDRFDTARSTFHEADSARLAFGQAMVGNFDWCLRFYTGDHYRCDDLHPLWNILGFARDDGWTLPLPYDFDLSGIVVGQHDWFDKVFSTAFVASRSRVEIEVLAQLQRTRSLFGRDRLDRTRAEFLAHRDAAYRVIAEIGADAGGQALATAHLDAFFSIIGSDQQFYRPVVVGENVMAFLDSAGTEAPCGDRSIIPVGTPVSAPTATEGDFVQVRLLDALWHWLPPRSCDRVHAEPIWVSQSAIDVAFPR